MFKMISLKIYAFLGVVVAILLSIVGYQRKEIKEKDREIKIKDFVSNAQEKQIKDEKEVLGNEDNQINKEIESRSNLDRSDRFNRM